MELAWGEAEIAALDRGDAPMSDGDRIENPGTPSHRDEQQKTSATFRKFIYVVFFWILIGICFIYGVRMWFNSPMHPSFVPITGAAFCVALAFTLVIALEYATGQIKLKFATVEFEGASGPIILWCVCFFVLVFGLYLLGLGDVAKNSTNADLKSVLDLFRNQK